MSVNSLNMVILMVWEIEYLKLCKIDPQISVIVSSSQQCNERETKPNYSHSIHTAKLQIYFSDPLGVRVVFIFLIMNEIIAVQCLASPEVAG